MKNKIKAVLFDLDGTLLPLDNDVLADTYFGEMTEFMAECGYDKDLFKKALFSGLGAMFGNNGRVTNEIAFRSAFICASSWDYLSVEKALDRFYRERFIRVKRVCSYSPLAKEVVDLAKSGGLKTVLATQPVFPRIATESRMKWAGLETEDFLLYTTYENSSFSKPSVGYYLDIAKRIGVAPEECLMVGNDVTDDMSCTSVGMKVFLLDDYLINRNGEDISAYPRGSFDALADYIKAL